MILINSKEFMEFTQVEMEIYIKKMFELKDNYLIGTVCPFNESYFLIEDLKNPLTGLLLDSFLTDARPIRPQSVLLIRI